MRVERRKAIDGWRRLGRTGLERERIRRKTCPDLGAALRDVLDCIEILYNPKRRHGNNDRLSPVEFEKQYFSRLETV